MESYDLKLSRANANKCAISAASREISDDSRILYEYSTRHRKHATCSSSVK